MVLRLGSPLAGFLADRTSRAHIVAGSIFVWSVVMALIGVARGWPMLLGLRAALGFAECLFLPAAIALLADHLSALHSRRYRAGPSGK